MAVKAFPKLILRAAADTPIASRTMIHSENRSMYYPSARKSAGDSGLM